MNEIMIVIAVIIIICVLLNKVSSKFGIPVLLVFLLLGMATNSLSIDTASDTNLKGIERLCTVALIFIMFYGGFGTRLKSAESVLLPSALLATAGVAVTAGCVGLLCHFLLKWAWLESLTMGAVISSTDAASVFAILRSRRLGLKNHTAPMLEIESGSNDPMSYMLTIIMISIFNGTASGIMMIKLLLAQFLLGAAIGFAIAYLLITLCNTKIKIGSTGFDSVLFVAIALAAYAIPSAIGGNGFLSTYIVGILLGNKIDFNGKKSVVNFLDGVTSMMQILIFYLLGTLTDIPTLHTVALPSLAIFGFITFIARPVAVFSVLGFWWKRYPIRQQILVSFVGLRGAASIVFAILVINSNFSSSHDLFNIVFYIVLLSILLQGSLIPIAAKKLDMIDAGEDVMKTFSDFSEEAEMSFGTIEIGPDNPWKNQMVRDLKLPKNLLLALLLRGNDKIVPKGHTTILAGDKIIICTKSYNNYSTDSIYQHRVSKYSDWAGHTIKEYPYKADRVIILINRGNERIIPNGDTLLLPNDLLTILDRDSNTVNFEGQTIK